MVLRDMHIYQDRQLSAAPTGSEYISRVQQHTGARGDAYCDIVEVGVLGEPHTVG